MRGQRIISVVAVVVVVLVDVIARFFILYIHTHKRTIKFSGNRK